MAPRHAAAGAREGGCEMKNDMVPKNDMWMMLVVGVTIGWTLALAFLLIKP